MPQPLATVSSYAFERAPVHTAGLAQRTRARHCDIRDYLGLICIEDTGTRATASRGPAALIVDQAAFLFTAPIARRTASRTAEKKFSSH